MNKVILIGNLTRDPELTQTTNGISVCKFSVATQRKFKNFQTLPKEGRLESAFVSRV